MTTTANSGLLKDYTPEQIAHAINAYKTKRRYVVAHTNAAQQKERSKLQYQKHRAQRLLKSKEAYQKNKTKRNLYQQAYSASHAQEKAIYDKKRRLQKPDYRKNYNFNYYIKNSACLNKKCKEWAKNNPERVMSQHQHYYIEHKDKIDNYARQHYFENKDKVSLYHHKYNAEHPEECRTKSARRRALLRNALGTFTTKEFKQKCLKYEYRCVYCGQQKPLGPDHAIPLAKHGSNYITNIFPCCVNCNSSKGEKTFEEFLTVYSKDDQEAILTRVYIAEQLQ